MACVICFTKIIAEDYTADCTPKLLKLCQKFLRFAFNEENSRGQLAGGQRSPLSLCPTCFVSTEKLDFFNDQLEFYQTKMAELVSSLAIRYANGSSEQHKENKAKEGEDIRSTILSTPNVANCANENSSNAESENVDGNDFENALLFPMSHHHQVENIEDVVVEEIKYDNNSPDIIDDENNAGPTISLAGMKFPDTNKQIIVESGAEDSHCNNMSKPHPVRSIKFKICSRGSYRPPCSRREAISPLDLLAVTKNHSKDCTNGNILKETENFRISPSSSSANHENVSSRLSNPLLVQSDVRIDRKGKPFSCNVCKKSYTDKSNLRRHHMIHSGERPFKCDFCGKDFAYRSRLNLHRKIHTGEKPFKCVICEQRFLQKIFMERHMRTHTGEKPYKCYFCNRSFAHKSSLHVHIRTHTKEKPYSCVVCNKHFTYIKTLQRHKRLHIRE